jgi:hypothetical protein
MRSLLILAAILTLLFSYGCSRELVGGAALGAGAAGAAYEYQNKEALEDLENDFRAGRISRDEYLRRKQEIQNKSVVY